MKPGDRVHPLVDGQPVTSVVGTVRAVYSKSVSVIWPWSFINDPDTGVGGCEMLPLESVRLIEPPFTLERGDFLEYQEATGSRMRFELTSFPGEQPNDATLRVWRKDPTDPDTMRCVWKREEQ